MGRASRLPLLFSPLPQGEGPGVRVPLPFSPLPVAGTHSFGVGEAGGEGKVSSYNRRNSIGDNSICEETIL